MILNRNNVIRETKSDRIFTFLNYFVLSLALAIFAYPLVFIVSASFSSGSALYTNKVWLFPVEFNTEGYKAVFNYRLIVTAFGNSFIYMGLGTAINLAMTIAAAYPLSRKDFPGGRLIALLFVFTMFFNSGLIPTYILVRNLGMRNTLWAMVIPNAMSVWNVIITRTYFETNLSGELLEATQIDGCSDFAFVMKMVIPLSMPILAVIALFYAVGHWNSFFNALIYLDRAELYPLQIALRQVLINNTIDFSMIASGAIDTRSEAMKVNMLALLKYSLIVVSSVPILMLYPFVQKHFVKGIMIGSIKG